MNYGYICEWHGPFRSKVRSDFCECPYEGCGDRARRDWVFHLDLSFEPYYAPSFGTIVKSRRHAKDLAKVASEEATRRLGFEHDFQVVDTHDDAAVGIDTDEKKSVMDNTRRWAVNGAVWCAERKAEIAKAKAEVTAKRKAQADA